VTPTYEELTRRVDAPPGSSWGLFGQGDQLGTLNFLTEERTAAAAGLVRRGATFNPAQRHGNQVRRNQVERGSSS
jgi:hypothetical protein